MQNNQRRVVKYVKIILIVIALICLISVLVLLPFIIDKVYECSPPNSFFGVELSKSDILDYYAQLLSLTATIILGVIAVVQTYRSQQKADEINELQLNIAKRELAVVEKQYAEELGASKAIVPKFEIKITGYSGWYSKINLEIKNISEMMISGFRIISFDVYKNEDEILSVKRWKLRFQSLASAETQNLEIFTPDMRGSIADNAQTESWENVKLIWKFSCDDFKGNPHFYSACLTIPNTKEYVGDYWDVNKIG